MSLLQAIVAASASGASAPPPNYTFSLSGNYDEGGSVIVSLDYENATGQTLYWTVAGESLYNPNNQINPNTDLTSTNGISGTTSPSGTGSLALTTLSFTLDTTTEGTEYFALKLGTSADAYDLIYNYYNTSDASQGGPMPGGVGTADTGQWNGITYTLTPSTNGSGTPGTAYPGDVITWSITSNPDDTSGRTMHWWVDGGVVPSNTWVENTNNGTVTLDGSGNASFSLTVASSIPTHALFKMYVGMSLYQGFVTHGYIGL